jgi:hypothetical protein
MSLVGPQTVFAARFHGSGAATDISAEAKIANLS